MASAAVFALLCAGFVSCRQTASAPLAVRHYQYADSTQFARMSISADLPDSSDAVSGAVRRALLSVLDESLGCVTLYEPGRLFPPFAGKDDDTEAFLGYYRDSVFAKLAGMAREDARERRAYMQEDDDLPVWGYDYALKQVSDTLDRLVFLSQSYIYMGGAHGGLTGQGYFTFDRKDGSLVREMVDPSRVEEMQPLLVKGLLSYYDSFGGTMTEEALRERLQIEGTLIPLPAWTPYPDGDALTFVYQQYEIACYADGMPSFTLPLEEIDPYLTPAARRLLGR